VETGTIFKYSKILFKKVVFPLEKIFLKNDVRRKSSAAWRTLQGPVMESNF